MSGPYQYRGYVHVKFKPIDCPARWYWARKIKDGFYKRLMKDGGEEISSKVVEGVETVLEEILVGQPLAERPARMNLHYGELEECVEP